MDYRVENFVGVLDRLRGRFDESFTSSGWSRTTTMNQLLGGSWPPFSADMISSDLARLSHVLSILTEEDISASNLHGWLDSVAPAYESLTFLTMGSNSSEVLSVLILINYLESNINRSRFFNISTRSEWESLSDNTELVPKSLSRRLRFVSDHLNELEPRSANIAQKIDEIDRAHATAEQLPTDMAELAARREELIVLSAEAQRLASNIHNVHESCDNNKDRIEELVSNSSVRMTEFGTLAQKYIDQCEQALRGATSVGLAHAFDVRRRSLSRASAFWTAGLVLALASAIYIGSERVETLKDVLISSHEPSVIWINFLLAILGVGAPVWFAWLSTKQISVNFRLSEDYAFKATVSQAYEGYRAEAVRIDEDLKKQLFKSALMRMEEAPIRLLEREDHSGPLAELLSNPTLRKSLESVPEITAKIIALIPTKAGVAAAVVAPIAAAATLSGNAQSAKANGGGSAEESTTD